MPELKEIRPSYRINPARHDQRQQRGPAQEPQDTDRQEQDRKKDQDDDGNINEYI